MAPIDHDMALPADPDCPPEHAKMGHCTPKDMPAAGMEDMAGKSGTDLPPGDATAPAPPGDWYTDRVYPAAEMDRSRSEEHTSELQSLMRISYAVFCLKKKQKWTNDNNDQRISV